jgi:L-histidine Nalpha-methyltransferase
MKMAHNASNGHPGQRFKRADTKMTSLQLDRHLPPDLLINAVRADAREGLTASPKQIPSKWLFDSKGSELWGRITKLPEYYPFSTERDILHVVADEIATVTQACSVIELGSGFADKIMILLSALRRVGTIRTYTSIDISELSLMAAGSRLIAEYPDLSVRAVLADFETQADIIAAYEYPSPRLILFLGGTIGQMMPDQRGEFLRKLHSVFRQGDMLLLGVDLVKDPAELMAAYDDSSGVSTAFNKNLLSVLNTQVGADFDLDNFNYVVTWDDQAERLAMWEESRINQAVRLSEIDLSIELEAGERIWTAISTKFRRDGIETELETAGFSPDHWWTDPGGRYALSLSKLT